MQHATDRKFRKKPLLLAALGRTVCIVAATALASSFAAANTEPEPEQPVAAVKASAGSKAKKTAPKKDTVAATKKGAGNAATRKKEEKAKTQPPGPLADFGKEEASDEVVHIANWASHTRNHQKKAFVVIDKKNARLYVFDAKAKLKSSTPVLLGKAIGDTSAPGVGSKPLSQLKEDEKTTPAGRFLAQPGKNNRGEDIIWIDYNAAVSMHRLRKVKEEEKRAERMDTEDASDNRISNGCVNVPHKFYNAVLKPTVAKQGAFVYVLPETRTPQQQFGSFDVPGRDKAVQVAEAPAEPARKRVD